jgi:prepilin-type N-terminal cleavage/methylation domain-containing protein
MYVNSQMDNSMEKPERGRCVRGGQAGFSLVEVVVAMVLLAVVVMSLGVLSTYTAQRAVALTNGSGRQAFALRETNRLAAMPYDSLPNAVGCDTLTTGQLSYNRCITVDQGARYRLVTIIVTPTKAGTYADTVVFRRSTDVSSNPLNLP